jgi:uncharacterized repeat protein (TIGR01451 family)
VDSPIPRINTADIEDSDQFDPDSANNNASAIERPQQADLSVLKTVNNPTPNVGDQVVYTITLTNAGPDDATGVAVTDLLPAGVTFVSAIPSQGTYDNVTGIWTVGTVTAAAPATLAITVTVVDPAVVTNMAAISDADQFDPNTGNNTDTADVDPQQADLAITKTVSDTTPNVGDQITFTVTLTNGGLAVATFVKAFGTAFLAMPRSAEADQAREVPRTMQAGLLASTALCIGLALAPTVLAHPLEHVTAVVRGVADGPPIRSNGVYLRLAGIQAGLSPLLLACGLLLGVVAALAVVRRARTRHTVRGVPAWGCGRTIQTARMEYTATSFAEPLQRVFDDVLHPEIDVDVDHHTESRHYVEAIRYRLQHHDAFERTLYEPLLRAARRWGEAVRRVQNGSIHRYLAYALITLIIVTLVSR